MPSAKPLFALALLLFAFPGTAQAGVNVYPADGPVPKITVEQPKPLEYKVQKGDTVAGIAKKFSVDAKTLLGANGLADAKKLKAGKTLVIPGKTAAAASPAVPVAATPAAPAPAKSSAADKKSTRETQPVAVAVADVKPDATARKASRKESLDPGVVEELPVKGKKGKKGKAAIEATPPPAIQIDDKLRASFGKLGVITNNTDVPQAIRDEFMRYAYKWVDELDNLGVGTWKSKKIKLVDGQWEASYRVIIRDSLGSEVKRVEYEHTPYVGHITYVQRVYTSRGPTKELALKGPYSEKDESIREIFSYSAQNKAWR